ncbi:hypothetical protein LSAT2_023351, partial [Lamellibrachia satsuma]
PEIEPQIGLPPEADDTTCVASMTSATPVRRSVTVKHDLQCNNCPHEGQGKCDDGQCFTGYGISDRQEWHTVLRAGLANVTPENVFFHTSDSYTGTCGGISVLGIACCANYDFCTDNGEGKCDRDHCLDGYVYDSCKQICTCYKCYNDDFCIDTTIPGLPVPGSEVSTLSSWGGLTYFLVLAAVAATR